VHIGDDDRESGVEQEFKRLADPSPDAERRIDQAFLAQQRNPGNHSDDVGCRTPVQIRNSPIASSGWHVEDQEIGHEKAEQQRENQSGMVEFHGFEIEIVGRPDVNTVA